MKCTHCNNKMVLRFNERRGYFWGCSIFPKCENLVTYQPLDDAINITFLSTPEEHKEQLMKLDSESYANNMIDFQVQMEGVLAHFIVCNLHYIPIFVFIREYFDNPVLLKQILKSSVIREDKNNTIIGDDGARIFYDLFFWLMNVNSIKVRNYLIENFPQYWDQYRNSDNKTLDYIYNNERGLRYLS